MRISCTHQSSTPTPQHTLVTHHNSVKISIFSLSLSLSPFSSLVALFVCFFSIYPLQIFSPITIVPNVKEKPRENPRDSFSRKISHFSFPPQTVAMDLWCVHVKNTHRSPFLLRRNSFPEKPPISWNLGKMGYLRGGEDGRVFEIRFSKRQASRYRSYVVSAMGKKNHENSSSSGNGDRSVPEGDGTKGNNPSSDSNKSNDTPSQNSHRITLDWREVRAALFAREQAEKADSDSQKQDGTSNESRPLGLKWAHPLSVPETGCLLVATEKLDGVRTFERTVVLLLRSGTRHPQEGPFGVVINRPLHKKIKHMKPTNLDLATTFADCSLHFGGPLEASMFLLKTGEKSQLPGFEEAMPGLCFGARNSLDEAAGMVKKGVVKPQDFRFFVGYAGWQLDQLREEIESDYWYVAACSSNLICGGSPDSSEGLWVEILQLMGGHYSELSRKPKQDS